MTTTHAWEGENPTHDKTTENDDPVQVIAVSSIDLEKD